MQSACAILSSVYLTQFRYFPHYLISGVILCEKVTEHKMCVSSCYTPFVSNISHSKKRTIYDEICIYRSYVKYPLFLSDFNP
jgi:hypothetical protein